MPYYHFDNCPEERLSQIEELVVELGLDLCKGLKLPKKQWIGTPFQDGGYLLAQYWPTGNSTLFLQTPSSKAFDDPEAVKLVKRFVSICPETRVYGGPPPREPYDMNLFK